MPGTGNTRRVDKARVQPQRVSERRHTAIDTRSEALHYTAMRQLTRTIVRRLQRTTLRKDGGPFHAFEYLA